jgi:heat shock protein HspQ
VGRCDNTNTLEPATRRIVGIRQEHKSSFVIGDKMGVNTMIKIGDLVRGHYFHRKIGVVVKIDPVAEMAFVKFTDTKQSWEPLANIRKATK